MFSVSILVVLLMDRRLPQAADEGHTHTRPTEHCQLRIKRK